MALLVEKTKSERGYTGTGRLINRILHSAATIYTLNARYVNPDEWDSPGSDNICGRVVIGLTQLYYLSNRVQPKPNQPMGQDV